MLNVRPMGMRLRLLLACGSILTATAASVFAAEEPAAEVPEASGAETARDTSPAETATLPPVTSAAVQAAIDRGVAFLLDVQNEDGSWGSATRTKGLNIYAPVPGAHHAFRTGVTSLSLASLLETGDEDDPRVQQAIDRGEAWLFKHLPELRRATPDTLYNVWGHAYSIQALVRLKSRKPGAPERQEKIRKLIELQFKRLTDYESVDGGWGYYDFRAGTRRPASSSTSFVNATVLIAFHEAKQAGFPPPQRLVDRAIAATQRQMKRDFSYIYGEYLKYRPMHPVNRPGGSLGRSQACNLALRLWGDERITDEVLETWLERLVTRHLWLDIGRKRPIPHEAWFAVAGYFFYYGHYYAALCIEELPADAQPRFQHDLARLLVPLQEKDGSWWDFPFYNYHQPYGTAFALMSLHRCRVSTVASEAEK